MMAAEELRAELLQGLDYYQWVEDEANHEQKEALQQWIMFEVERGYFEWLWYNGQMIAVGKASIANHVHGWLELHVLPKLDAAIPATNTLKAQAERGELMMPNIVLELSKLEDERDHWKAEAARWRNVHASVVTAKRNLSAKYGAIMRRKPGALWRRAKKRIKRIFA